MDINSGQSLFFTSLSKHEIKHLFREGLEAYFLEHPLPVMPQLPEPEKPKGIQEAAAFLNLAPNTLYGLTSRKEISFTKKGKKILFFDTDLLNYLESGKQKSKRQIEEDVEHHTGLQGQKKLLTKNSNK